jgi:integrase
VSSISLTQRAVETLKAPPRGRIEYFDRTLPGFGLRISDAGRKTWFVMYRVRGRKVRETIGTVATIPNVGDARQRARESIELAQRGVHPAEAREEAEAVEAARSMTFATVADRYLVEYVERNTRPSTLRETRRILNRDVKPKWGHRPIRDITRHDVNEVLDEIADRGALLQANRTLGRLKTLFSWALDNELADTDPTARVRKRVKEIPRDRTLSPDEIRYFWAGCDKLGWPFGPLFKLLLLTAQRRDEVGAMEWRELDLHKRAWTIPRERAKNDRQHVVHLADLAAEIIDALPQIVGQGSAEGPSVPEPRLVFTNTGRTPVSGFSKAKDRLDRHMLDLLRSELAEAGKDASQAGVGEWILHDLRRTAATGMASLNIAPHVVDRILNHVSGTIRGVAAVYNRHAYLDERKAALEGWSRHVQSLVRPGPNNVVHLSRGRGATSPGTPK